MKIRSHTEFELVVEDSSLWLAAILGIGSLPLFYAAVFTGKKENLIPAGFFVLCAVICVRKSRFVFDARERVVQWKSFVLLKTSTGSLPFDDIRDIGIETSLGGNANAPTYRLTILTAHGSIPLESSYSPGKDRYATMRETILAFLKPGTLNPASTTGTVSRMNLSDLEPSLLELVRANRTVDAIALLRSMEKISLTEAVQRVRAIESRLKPEK